MTPLRSLALLALVPALAAAAPVPPTLPLAATVETTRTAQLQVSLDLAPAFPAGLERQLGNGLTNVIAIHVALQPARGGEPLALFAREVQVLYDVWEESYGILVRDPQSPRGRRVTLRTFQELQTLLSDARTLPMGAAPPSGSGPWVVHARVELNPVNRELLQRTRELIADPASGVRGAPSRSVLGAMASSMLRAEPGAEVRLFRSRAFHMREVPPR